ncbi:hypothetical protein GCM10023166_33580 [Paeniglutamicibacter cryotolerans]|uniref:Uncharacterized protein n=1 Tax=Paeniglutamicibacter cryotolerans TaxID=670079 RepID=A0A839QYQ2_9MICC|nr:hypothetical protein [Paeniglutamicibacter cryotolerans]
MLSGYSVFEHYSVGLLDGFMVIKTRDVLAERCIFPRKVNGLTISVRCSWNRLDSLHAKVQINLLLAENKAAACTYLNEYQKGQTAATGRSAIQAPTVTGRKLEIATRPRWPSYSGSPLRMKIRALQLTGIVRPRVKLPLRQVNTSGKATTLRHPETSGKWLAHDSDFLR